MNDEKYINVSESYLKELEEKAKNGDYLKGYITGTENVIYVFERIITSIQIHCDK